MPSAAAPATGSGLGLVGMAERVSVFGGTLKHGSSPAGRFELPRHCRSAGG